MGFDISLALPYDRRPVPLHLAGGRYVEDIEVLRGCRVAITVEGGTTYLMCPTSAGVDVELRGVRADYEDLYGLCDKYLSIAEGVHLYGMADPGVWRWGYLLYAVGCHVRLEWYRASGWNIPVETFEYRRGESYVR